MKNEEQGLTFDFDFEESMGKWIPFEYTKHYENGADLRIRGVKCSVCGFERHYKQGPSKYCEDCGTRMEVQDETN